MLLSMNANILMGSGSTNDDSLANGDPNYQKHDFCPLHTLSQTLDLGMEKLRAQVQITVQILEIFRQSAQLSKSLEQVCAKLLDIDHINHVYFYRFDKLIACSSASPYQFNDRDLQGVIVAEASEQFREQSEASTDDPDPIDALLYKLKGKSQSCSFASQIIDNNHVLLPLVLLNNDGEIGAGIEENAAQSHQLVWGFLGIMSTNIPDFVWQQDDLMLLQNVAIQSEIAIARYNREQQLQIRVKEIEQAYNTLYHWTEQYRYLVEQVPSVSYLSPLLNLDDDETEQNFSDAYDSFAYISPQVQELLGLSVNSYSFNSIFRDWYNYIHPEDRDRVYQKLQHTLDTGSPFFCEYRMIRRDGEIIWVSDTAQIGLSTDGKTRVMRGSVYDISDRKSTEAKLAAAQIAEAANQSKSKFLAVMSHEIRTPMNTVIGMTELLLGTELSSQQQHYVSTIRQGGEMLLSIVDNILDFSRIEAGQMELEENCFRLQECVDDMLAIMSPRAEQKSLSISVGHSQNVPSYIIGDRGRLRQILINLVNNAIKFTQQGGITISISSQLTNADANTFKILFDIHDTGLGIDPDSLQLIFQSFKQADSSINRQYGGTGLGLVICKQLCEMMGGSINVTSEVGKGSTFSFSICVKAVTIPKISEIQDALDGSKNVIQYGVALNREIGRGGVNDQENGQQALDIRIGDRYPLQILVVEDHPVNREILLLMLDRMGYLAEAVCDGKEAVDVTSYRRYDLIFMDLQMPIMDGTAATKQIRKLAKHQPWIVGLSANAFSDSRDAALAAGMDDYVTKPLQAETLSMVVNTVAQRTYSENLKDVDDRSNYIPFIDVKTLASLENSIGKENVSNLVDTYLEHTAISIAKMQTAITQHDLRAIDAESHTLKGGSGTFGAIRLMAFCQKLESVCRHCMGAKQCNTEDIDNAQRLIDCIHSEYNLIKQSIHRVLFNINAEEDTLIFKPQSLVDRPLRQK